MKILPAVLCISLLSSCFMSTGRTYRGDAYQDVSPTDPVLDDTAREDAAEDDPPLPDGEPTGYRFVDRDSPDRNVPVSLLFAATPSVAYNGSRAGIVYAGQQSGDATPTMAFMPVDAYGANPGIETILLSGGGMYGSIPQIADDGDGSFLFCTLQESGGDRIVVLRLYETGEALARGESPPASNITGPWSPPLRMGGSVFVAAESYEADRTGIFLVRLTYPDLWPDGEIYEYPDGGRADTPVLTAGPEEGSLLVLYRDSDSRVVARKYTRELEPLDTFTPFADPQDDFSASAAGGNWFVFGSQYDYETGLFKLNSVTSLGDVGLFDNTAEFFGYVLRSDSDGLPAWGAAFSLYKYEHWDLRVSLTAYPVPLHGVAADIVINDRGEDHRIDEIPWADLAWTENGFLVVWDEWRTGYNYSLFSSFIALETEY
jgi:hypothetical protein